MQQSPENAKTKKNKRSSPTTKAGWNDREWLRRVFFSTGANGGEIPRCNKAAESCQYWGEAHGQWFSTSKMCRALQKQQLTRKKRHYAPLKQQRPRVQKLRGEDWEQVKQIKPLNLVFLDETGVLRGLTKTHARCPRGSRVYDLKPFYRGATVIVIGAISLSGVVALMT
jgi:transposase